MKQLPLWASILVLVVVVVGIGYTLTRPSSTSVYRPANATLAEKKALFKNHFEYEYEDYDVILYNGETYHSKDGKFSITLDDVSITYGEQRKISAHASLVVGSDTYTKEFGEMTGPGSKDVSIPTSLGVFHLRACEIDKDLDHAQNGEMDLMVDIDKTTKECPSLAG